MHFFFWRQKGGKADFIEIKLGGIELLGELEGVFPAVGTRSSHPLDLLQSIECGYVVLPRRLFEQDILVDGFLFGLVIIHRHYACPMSFKVRPDRWAWS
jgi:hypothetical protein